LYPFLNWWRGGLPSGIVGAVFPSLATILLKEDDVDVLSVSPLPAPQITPFVHVLDGVLFFLGQVVDLEWTTIIESPYFTGIPRDITMVFITDNLKEVFNIARKSSDGKSGLEILMILIERGLDPSMDESQRILSGPLIADLVQKVPLPPPFPCILFGFLLSAP
jgi:hypothetical protein